MVIRKKGSDQDFNISNKTFYSDSAEETIAFGRVFSKILKPGDIIFLIGELGSGKTTLTKGLAQGLGIKKTVKSSSFLIANEYKGKRNNLYHIDLYRLEGSDIESLGLEEYIYGDGICVIEWADKMKGTNLPSGFDVYMDWVDENKRKIVIRSAGC